MVTSIAAVSLLWMASANLAAAASQTCYNLFGQADESLRPCDPDAATSACCRSDDICLSSGLCMSTAKSWAGFIWANGCTDATLADEKCPNQCTANTAVNSSSSYNVLQCTYPFNNGTVQRDPEWCCRSATDYDNCCNNSTLVFNDTQEIGLFLTPGSTQALNAAEPYVLASDCTANSTSNTTSADAALTSASCPADHTAVVGGALGGVLGAALIGALAVIAFLLRSRKGLKSQVTSTTMQRDDALKQVSDEKALLAQMHQQQEAQQAQFAPNPMMAYQQSGAFGQGVPPAPGYGNSHIYGQYSDSTSNVNSVTSPVSLPPAEMSAVKFAEIDGHAAPMELSVEEVQPTPLGSAHGGSVKSKGSS